jgi:hypothetical protein
MSSRGGTIRRPNASTWARCLPGPRLWLERVVHPPEAWRPPGERSCGHGRKGAPYLPGGAFERAGRERRATWDAPRASGSRNAVASFVEPRGEGLAYAVMIAEPNIPTWTRRAWRARAAGACLRHPDGAEGDNSGELAGQDAPICGAAIAALYWGRGRPTGRTAAHRPDRSALSAEIARFCQSARSGSATRTNGKRPGSRGDPRNCSIP